MLTTTNLTESTETKRSRPRGKARVSPQGVFSLVERVFQDDLHAKTVLSLSMGVVGVLWK